MYFVALQYILQHRANIPRYESLVPYYEFLGLHTTTGVCSKTQDLSNLVSDPMMSLLLLTEPGAHQKLSAYLARLGMLLGKGGEISANHAGADVNQR